MIHIEKSNQHFNKMLTIIDYYKNYSLNFNELASLFKYDKNEFEKVLINCNNIFDRPEYNTKYYKDIKKIKIEANNILRTKYEPISRRKYFVAYTMYEQEKHKIENIIELLKNCNHNNQLYDNKKIVDFINEYNIDIYRISKTFNIPIENLQHFSNAKVKSLRPSNNK